MYDGKKDKTKDYSLGLHGAAMNGNVGLVKFALDHGAPIDSVVNGYMPLQLACINENHIAVVQYLIDRGADVNAQRWSRKHSADKSQAVAGATGSTALHVACANGCTKIVDLLLRNGAKINVKDKYGSRPVDVAAAKHHVEIVKLLETFGSMQIMLKGLQEGKHVAEAGRRSMDAASYQQQQQQQQAKADRLRRPSLPSVFEHQLHIPDISTLPPPRHSLNTPRPSADELQQDYYSYGVVNHYEDENYLTSLERRAFGVASPTTTPSAYFSNHDLEENKIIGRASLDSAHIRPCLDSTPLKRCSSDGGHLRTTALMNAMAANNISLQDDENGNVIEIDDDADEETPRPSLGDDRPDIEQLKPKKTWFSSGRKSVDMYPIGRPSLENNQRRSSLDFRPSLDSLSQLAKKSMEGLSRKSIDMDHIPSSSATATATSSRGFLSKWWSNSESNAK
ncbi:p48 polypeptide of DNA primase [Mucor velutinosus]|uniref:P48 polypeptide of DNA primase n=1 Tax=Mucor velutinosus TaxID=708070 RepID=A0AAN7DAY1_9FUNG|nr:p48 polypeptide of DNA primase [Mucor velutinosus]